jgi:hypothetical protein
MRTLQPYHIAIIGGGQAAKALLMLLAERAMSYGAARPETRVAIFERSHQVGPGTAWSPEHNLPEHLSSQPGGASRPEFGREQIRVMARLVGTLRTVNIHVDIATGVEIVDLRRTGEEWVLLGAHASWRAEAVVLATGHWRNTPGVLEQIPHESPWPAPRLQDVVGSHLGSGASIAVLGSYHTAIDTALTIALVAGRFEENGGELRYMAGRSFTTTLLSRTGRLPLVWPPTVAKHALRSDDPGTSWPLRLDELMPLLCRQFPGGHGVCSEAPAARGLRRMLEKVYAGDPSSRLERALHPDSWTERNLLRVAALATMLPEISERFPLLDAESYLRFQQDHRTAFFNVAMPMARMTAARILALMRAGVLKVEPLGRRRWQVVEGRPTLIGEPDAPAVAPRGFDLLVNGLASCGPIARHPGKLMRSLLRQQLIMPAYRRFAAADGQHREHMLTVDGVHVDPASCQIISPRRGMSNALGSRLYAMGANNAGLFLDAQSVGQLARDARRIVSRLTSAQALKEVS